MKAEDKDLLWHKKTLNRVFDIIKSCETLKQYDVAVKMLENYTSTYAFTMTDLDKGINYLLEGVASESKKAADAEVKSILNDINEHCKKAWVILKKKADQDDCPHTEKTTKSGGGSVYCKTCEAKLY
jgi:hypothetical protein